MKKKYILALFAALILCGACAGNTGNHLTSTNKVEAALREQMESQDALERAANPEGADIPESISATKEETTAKASSPAADKSVDYDLTVMDSDLVYASIYQLMVDPEPYVGKSFKMQGTYYASYYEPTAKHYHYIVIEDALACCAQGIEFVRGDGSYVYPDDYPANQTRIEISGTFETYKEEGDDRLYCRVVNAKFRVLES